MSFGEPLLAASPAHQATSLADRISQLEANEPQPAAPNARETLTTILARTEFRKKPESSWLAQTRERIGRLLIQLLSALVGSSAFPVVSTILIYGLIAAAVGVVLIVMLRALSRAAHADVAHSAATEERHKAWTAWLRDARAAAGQGDWRRAIHHTYWSAIVHLESQQTWRRDPSRTPREYLRMLPGGHDAQPGLIALTRLVESVWYGTAPADSIRFDEALEALRGLGCPVD